MPPAGKPPQTFSKSRSAETQIVGHDNRWLKTFRAALRGGETSADGCVGVEGPHLVEEALRSGVTVEAVLVSTSGEGYLDRLRPWLGPAVRPLRTSDRLFASVADTKTPQGIAALVRPRAASLDDFLRGLPLVVVLVGVQDPGNVGTILRAAEAFGASGVATCAFRNCGTANPLGPKALRASTGSALRLPILAGIAAPILLAQLRVMKLRLYAASPERARDSTRGATRTDREASPAQPILSPWEADLRGPVALLVGNEGAGLPPEIERSADALLRIPLAAGVDSLNAAVAASVLLYEVSRQRRNQP